MNDSSRVVITSYEVVSSFGIGRTAFWDGLCKGSGRPSDIALFKTEGLRSRQAYMVPDFRPEQYLGRKGLRHLDRSTVLLLTVSKLLMEADGNKALGANQVVIGTEFGGLHSIFQFEIDSMVEGVNYVNPMDFSNTVMNAPASRVNIYHAMDGLSATVSTGFTASLDAFTYATNLIRSGKAEVLLVGGVDELCLELFYGHYLLGLLAGDHDSQGEITRPFDKKRTGIMLGEGSALMVLESLEHARRNKRTILAEVAGTGSYFSPEGFSSGHPTLEGAKGSMLRALQIGRSSPEEIDYISGNSNGSRLGDRIELMALSQVFGNAAGRLTIGSIKSAVGECCGASGALQVAATLAVMEEGTIPPTVNFEETDADLAGVGSVPDHAMKKDVCAALINGFDCFGFHSSLLLRSCRE